MDEQCPMTPSMSPTTTTSRWGRLKDFLLDLPSGVLTYLMAGADATNKVVEFRLIAFMLGALLIMVLIAIEFNITRKLNNTALATLAGLISVGSLSTMRRGE